MAPFEETGMAANRWAAIVLIAGALVVPASMASAQQNCAPRETVVKRLAARYGETRRTVGRGQDDTIIEVFASAISGTWTMTVTTTDGQTCLIASGQAFETIATQLPAISEEV